jgi:hypothetical protein
MSHGELPYVDGQLDLAEAAVLYLVKTSYEMYFLIINFCFKQEESESVGVVVLERVILQWHQGVVLPRHLPGTNTPKVLPVLSIPLQITDS